MSSGKVDFGGSCGIWLLFQDGKSDLITVGPVDGDWDTLGLVESEAHKIIPAILNTAINKIIAVSFDNLIMFYSS